MNDNLAAKLDFEPNDAFIDLVDSLVDGTIAPEQHAELARVLAADPALRQWFVDYMQLQASLTWGGDELADPAFDVAAVDQPSPIFSPLSVAMRGAVGFFSQEMPLGFLVATLLTGLLLLGMWLTPVSKSPSPQIANLRGKSLGSSGNLDETIQPDVAEKKSDYKPEVKYVGRITGESSCEWKLLGRGHGRVGVRVGSGSSPNPEIPKSRNPQIPASSNLQAPAHDPFVAFGDKLAVASGLLEITYDSGAKVILEGPCTFRIENNGGFLSVGRLTGRMEKKTVVASGQWPVDSAKPQAVSHGLSSPSPLVPRPSFTIATPTALVTDLGTEFGVDVDRAGRTVSHVFRGSVQVQVASISGKRYGGLSSEKKLLHENESACVELQKEPHTGAMRPTFGVVDVNPHVFTRLLPDDVGDYVDLVRSLKPVAYYRMERPNKTKDKLVVADCVGGHHGVLHVGPHSGDPWQKGVVGGALAFDGHTYVDVPAFPAAENDELSLSAWVFLSRQNDWASIASEQFANAMRGSSQMQFHIGVFASGDLWASVVTRDGHLSRINEGSLSPLLVGYWTHVAFVADGKRLRLYRSGAEVAECPCDGICRMPLVKHLTIGCKNWNVSADSPDVKPMQFWRGCIDELAIFNHALSPSEVRRLCRSGLRETHEVVFKQE